MKTIFFTCVVLAGLASAQEDNSAQTCNHWNVYESTQQQPQQSTVALGGLFVSPNDSGASTFFGGAALNVSLRNFTVHDTISKCDGRVVARRKDGTRFEFELTSNLDWHMSALSTGTLWETGTDTHVYLETAIGVAVNSTFVKWMGEQNAIGFPIAPFALLHTALMLGVDFDAGGQRWFVEGGVDTGGFYSAVEVRAGLKFF